MPGAGTAASPVPAGDRVADVMITRPRTLHPDCGLAALLSAFTDDHFHMALIVAASGRLVTTIERADLNPAPSAHVPVGSIGALAGRTVNPAEPLGPVTATLVREGRRRLAVVDESGGLAGLLCLKADGTAYCSDGSVRERELSWQRRDPGGQAPP